MADLPDRDHEKGAKAARHAKLPSRIEIENATSIRVAAMIEALPKHVRNRVRGKMQNVISDAAGIFEAFNNGNPESAISVSAIQTGGDTVNAIVSKEIADERYTVAERAAWLQRKRAEAGADSPLKLKRAFLNSMLASMQALVSDAGDEAKADAKADAGIDSSDRETVSTSGRSEGGGFARENYGNAEIYDDNGYRSGRFGDFDEPRDYSEAPPTVTRADGKVIENGTLQRASAIAKDKILSQKQKNEAVQATLIDPKKLAAQARASSLSGAALTPTVIATPVDPSKLAATAAGGPGTAALTPAGTAPDRLPAAGTSLSAPLAQPNEALQASVRPSDRMQALRRMMTSAPLSLPIAKKEPATPPEENSASAPEAGTAKTAKMPDTKEENKEARSGSGSGSKYQTLHRHQPNFARRAAPMASATPSANAPKVAAAEAAPAAPGHAVPQRTAARPVSAPAPV